MCCDSWGRKESDTTELNCEVCRRKTKKEHTVSDLKRFTFSHGDTSE